MQGARLSRSLEARSQQAARDGDHQLALRWLRGAVQCDPNNRRLRTSFAEQLAKSATTRADYREATVVLTDVLRTDPSRHDLRRSLVRSALAIGQQGDVQPHLQVLRSQSPGDPQLPFLTGWSEELRGHRSESARYYRQAVAASPGEIAAWCRLSRLLRDHLGRRVEAFRLLDEMVLANPASAPALVERGRFLAESGDLRAAALDLIDAQQLDPYSSETALLASELLPHLACCSDILNADQVRGFLRTAVARHPLDPRLYESLAELDLQSAQPAKARQWLLAGLAANPGQPELRKLLRSLPVLAGRSPLSELSLQ